MNFIWLVLAVIFNIYFVVLQFLSPSTFIGTIFSFSFFWFLGSVFFIFIFLMQKNGLLKCISRKIKIAFSCIVSVVLLIAGINLFHILTPKLCDETEKIDYVIILGGGITKDAELSDSVHKRLEKASEYLKTHPDAITVVTGGKGPFSPCDEASVLSKNLIELGIEKERILLEPNAKDTIQNFIFSAQVLSEYTGKSLNEILNSPIAVVTSDFHIARAEKLAERIGYTNIYGIASKTPDIFIPNHFCREICCYVKLNLRILFTGKPHKISS